MRTTRFSPKRQLTILTVFLLGVLLIFVLPALAAKGGTKGKPTNPAP